MGHWVVIPTYNESDRFVDQILDAIEKHYKPALEETDCTIYVPKVRIM
jgi:hypothetical protein